MSLGLAPKMVDLVFESLGRLKTSGVTMIIIEQFVHRALEFADQCVLLSRGQVAWQGAPGVADREILARYLGEDADVTAN
jgi:branched-chain amino acid transport system ATP-binding protein